MLMSPVRWETAVPICGPPNTVLACDHCLPAVRNVMADGALVRRGFPNAVGSRRGRGVEPSNQFPFRVRTGGLALLSAEFCGRFPRAGTNHLAGEGTAGGESRQRLAAGPSSRCLGRALRRALLPRIAGWLSRAASTPLPGAASTRFPGFDGNEPARGIPAVASVRAQSVRQLLAGKSDGKSAGKSDGKPHRGKTVFREVAR